MPSDNKSNSKPTAADNKSSSKTTTAENKSGSKTTTADNKTSGKTTTVVNKNKTTTADNCVVKNGSSSSSSSSASPPPKQQPTDVLAACSGNQCFERQRELIDCLTYETTASQSLDEQLALDERSLAGQLVAATDSKERSTAELFDLANRMDAAFCEYRESVMAAEAASRALAEQRDAVHEGQAKVENLSSRLAEAKTSVAAYVQLKHDSGDFSVYATGCGPRDAEHSTRSGGVDCVVAAGATTTRPVPAASKTPPPQTPILS